jgi:hypothetical protein
MFRRNDRLPVFRGVFEQTPRVCTIATAFARQCVERDEKSVAIVG